MDTFRILMVLPSVFTRGWNPRGPILTQKSTPGGGSENPFFGVPGDPPHPPRVGGRGGAPPPGPPPPPPWGGSPPLPGGGKPRPKRTPPWGTPNLCINL